MTLKVGLDGRFTYDIGRVGGQAMLQSVSIKDLASMLSRFWPILPSNNLFTLI